jgi:hypothetical protein
MCCADSQPPTATPSGGQWLGAMTNDGCRPKSESIFFFSKKKNYVAFSGNVLIRQGLISIELPNWFLAVS